MRSRFDTHHKVHFLVSYYANDLGLHEMEIEHVCACKQQHKWDMTDVGVNRYIILERDLYNLQRDARASRNFMLFKSRAKNASPLPCESRKKNVIL